MFDVGIGRCSCDLNDDLGWPSPALCTCNRENLWSGGLCFSTSLLCALSSPLGPFAILSFVLSCFHDHREFASCAYWPSGLHVDLECHYLSAYFCLTAVLKAFMCLVSSYFLDFHGHMRSCYPLGSLARLALLEASLNLDNTGGGVLRCRKLGKQHRPSEPNHRLEVLPLGSRKTLH